MVFAKCLDLIKCKRCSSRLDTEVLECGDDGKVLDAVLNCVGCGVSYVVSDGVFLGVKSRINQDRIRVFNEKYNRRYSIEFSGSDYIDFVENEQYPRKETVADVFRKILAGGYYVGVIVLVAAFLWFFGSARDKGRLYRKRAGDLAREYYYVPEMAIQKIIEMEALEGAFDEIPRRLLDIGGGNGIVTGIFLGNRRECCVNVDLFAAPSQTYDLIISDDIRSPVLNAGSFDGAMSICVLEHIPEAHTLLPYIASLLSPGAVFAFTTPRKRYVESLVLVRLLSRLMPRSSEAYKRFDLKKSHHVSLYGRREMMGYIDAAGFSGVSVVPFYKAGHLFVYDLINLPAKLPSSWYFWAELKQFLDRIPFLKRMFCRMVYGMLLRLDLNGEREKNRFTHYLYVCRK